MKLVLKIILKFPRRSRTGIKAKIVASIEKPAIFFVLVLGVFIALYISMMKIIIVDKANNINM